jgi:hypothetical protein
MRGKEKSSRYGVVGVDLVLLFVHFFGFCPLNLAWRFKANFVVDA